MLRWLSNTQGVLMADDHDLAKIYYGAARAEILQRLAMREQVLLAGVTAFGVIGGLALGDNGGRQYLFGMFPFLSFAFVVLLFRHHFLMTKLGQYIHSELDRYLGFSDPVPAHWNNWISYGESSKDLRLILAMELLGAWLLLWLPGMIALLGLHRKVSVPLKSVDSVLLIAALAPFILEAKRLVLDKNWRRATTPADKVKLTAEERAGLTPRVRAYIEYLEGEISQLGHESDKMKGTLRKIN
jgi:hypothetical protein